MLVKLTLPLGKSFVIYISLYIFLPLPSYLSFYSFDLFSSWIGIQRAFVAQGKKVSIFLGRKVSIFLGLGPALSRTSSTGASNSVADLCLAACRGGDPVVQGMKLDKMQKCSLINTLCLSLGLLSQLVTHL